MDGQEFYIGNYFPRVHTALNISDKDFNATLKDFNDSLIKMKVESDVLYEIMLRLEKLRKQIVKPANFLELPELFKAIGQETGVRSIVHTVFQLAK